MRIHELIALCNKAEMHQSVQGKRKYLCPKCNGTGNILHEFSKYPTIYLGSSPDGVTYRPCECDLCNGEGYINKSTANKAQENITQDYNYVHLC